MSKEWENGGSCIKIEGMCSLNETELWFWLCNLPGIGRVKLMQLLDYFEDPREIYTCTEENLRNIPGLSNKDYGTILHSRSIDNIRKQFLSMEHKGIRFIPLVDAEYPPKLREIYDSPFGIYVLGKLPDPTKISIAIIGTRYCSPYGREVAKHYGMELAKAGVQVISGMARGVDSYGHQGALQAGGYTLAVLGSGIDYCYPKENIELYMQLERDGGVLSEYGPGVLPRAGHFPLRNRIISGMCDGILVVEAKKKSGSLITVDQGLEQGKDVFAIPGRVCDTLSEGTNQLIQSGAQVVTKPQDILEYYNLMSGNTVLKNDDELELMEIEANIMKRLSLDPIHIGVLAEHVHMDYGKLMIILIEMERKGIIAQTSKNYYIRVMA